MPNMFFGDSQIPSPLPGREIEKLPEDIKIVYDEVRKTLQASCYTAAIMLMRKLIMNLAVDLGKAKEGLSFIEYVDFLYNEHYAPRRSKGLLDKVRKLGNDTNHKCKPGSAEDAHHLFKFIEQLLVSNYEFADNEKAEDDKPERGEANRNK